MASGVKKKSGLLGMKKKRFLILFDNGMLLRLHHNPFDPQAPFSNAVRFKPPSSSSSIAMGSSGNRKLAASFDEGECDTAVVIPLANAVITSNLNANSGNGSSSADVYEFTLQLPSRSYRFYLSSHSLLQQWLAALPTSSTSSTG